ncbi:MAG: uroporphyrinogen decarboxylase [Geminicoccaceae bacterium]|nr:uroporphyrinogen decarboxylase [Geminicoccaceae bacterium]
MAVRKRKLVQAALAGEFTDEIPVWFMRQAGRYLPEYRRTRTRAGSFLDLCYTPELAIEVTLQPLRRFPFDAAILFSDILVIPDALGADVGFVEGEGPKLTPLRHEGDLAKLSSERVVEHLAPVFAILEGLRGALPPHVTLIGFAGAPWTLAAYMIEGAGSKDFPTTRLMARTRPGLFKAVIDLLCEAITIYLRRQVESGAEVIQLFDSWANVLAPDERQRWCDEPTARIVDNLRAFAPDIPVIAFPRAIGPACVDFARVVRPDGLSLDTSLDPAWAATALPGDLVPCLQGNLDPMAVVAGGETMIRSAERIADAWAGRPYIFNLGHGIVPQTPPENVLCVVEHLKSRSR